MTDTEFINLRLGQKYGELMSVKDVMSELGIRTTRKLNAINPDRLPKTGGGKRGCRVSYKTTDVADYILSNPSRKTRGNQVAIDPRELVRFYAKHQLTPVEKAGVMDVWSAALVYGGERARLDIHEASFLSGCDERLLKRMAKRGIPLNPLESGVFGVSV